MCGITGFILNKKIDTNIIKKMVTRLYHRGPDEDGYYKDGRFVGGQRRLSINDLKHGTQPLYNKDKSVILLYNGEIYNYYELKASLEEKGYVFQTHSDGEVICHMYDEYGENLFNMLDGMFAISLWDSKLQKLFLVRDYVGEKPLYYSILSSNEIVYSSELKALKDFTPLKLELNKQAIWDYLSFLWIPEPDTIYKNVYALNPGNMIIISNDNIEIKKYINFQEYKKPKVYKNLVSDTRIKVIDSIKSRLISDVDIGCFLSGGIDSSIITAIASKEVSELRTYTIGFEKGEDPYGGNNDESGYAEDFAKRLNTIHKTIRVKAKDFKDILEEFVHYADQPFGVSSGLGIYLITKEAQKDNIKVLLSGDGADENFGGYSWYKYLNDVPYTEDSSNKTIMGDSSFHNSCITLDKKLEMLKKYSSQKRAWGWHYYASEFDKNIIFSENLKKNVNSSLRFFENFNQSHRWEAIEYIKQDREFYLPNEMLKKADRMGMGNSVEIRVPFVSKSILEFTKELSYDDLIKDDKLKILLKDAFKDVITEEIINRPKHGFNVPIDLWLKNGWEDLVEKTFMKASFLRQYDIISPELTIDSIRNMINDDKRLHGHTIFCLIILNMWLEKEFND